MKAELKGHVRIRALFLDVDGTLVGVSDTVSPGVKHALDAAHRKGCEIVICTGRARFTAESIAVQMPNAPGYIVTSNGGVTMHLGTGEVLHRRLLPIPVALKVIRAFHDADVTPYVYEDAVHPGIESARVLHPPGCVVGPYAITPRYRPHPDILENLPFTPVSINAYGPPERMRPLGERLRRELPSALSILESGSSNHWGVEVFAPGVDKRLGLETIAAHLGIAQEEIMAIGDHINDREMIRWAGVGVAMGNALPEIQAVADWVTGTLEEDGVARAIERYVI